MKYECRYNMQTVKGFRADVLQLILQLCWQINEQKQVEKEGNDNALPLQLKYFLWLAQRK